MAARAEFLNQSISVTAGNWWESASGAMRTIAGVLCVRRESLDVGHDCAMLVLAHRGASAAAPENTPAAFELADEMGSDGIELDVRLTPDGRLLVAHDPLPESVADIDALGCATFRDVLDACGERMLLNVEIKNWPEDSHFDPTMKMVEPILEELRRRGEATLERVLISSFSFPTIDACRAIAPEIATAWLRFDAADDRAVERVVVGGHVAINLWEPMVDRAAAERCHDAGIALNAWTCNDAERLIELDAIGVDGVCTDVPDIALLALRRQDRAVSPRWPSST